MIKIELKGDSMIEEGLLMEVEVMPSIDVIQRKKMNKSAIPIVRTKALIDTGAKTCAIDRTIIQKLGVKPHMVSSVKTPFHTVIDSEVYQLIFKIPREREYFPITAVIADFSEDTCKALIGRDFLQYCTLVYDGKNKKGTLETD